MLYLRCVDYLAILVNSPVIASNVVINFCTCKFMCCHCKLSWYTGEQSKYSCYSCFLLLFFSISVFAVLVSTKLLDSLQNIGKQSSLLQPKQRNVNTPRAENPKP